MLKPYIGICDFTAPEQSERLLALMPENFSHDLMVGVMMSKKTLNDIPSKWTNVYPKKESIADIFTSDMRAMNTIHYADYDVGDARDQALADTLVRVERYGGRYLDAIQLDMIWPDAEAIKRFRERSDTPIVLQVGRDAMQECGNDPIKICEHLSLYGKSIDYVLFDESMGHGKGMSALLIGKYVRTLLAELPHLMPAVAGGLGPCTMHLVEPLTKLYPNISMDMQSRMRKSGDAKFPIEWDRAESAFVQAVALFS